MKLTKSKLQQIIKEELEFHAVDDLYGEEISRPFDPKLDEFREVMSDLGMAVAYHYKERGADRSQARGLIMEVINAAIEGFEEDTSGGDELKHVLDDVYEEEESSEPSDTGGPLEET